MTSLATQLKQLARPQTEAVQLLEDPHRKSLLFDPNEAARLDRETFYAIGVNGLHELINLDSSFQEFEETLFDVASKSLERSVQSKVFNDRLDEKINQFLLRLIPYLPLKQAHKALEWLVHRFHVYHYNIPGLMSCILPYYQTKIFVRILQLMDFSDPTSHWHWLQPLQNAGIVLSRTVLLNHCSSNLGFLKFVGDILLKAIKVHSRSKEDISSLLRVVIAFYVSTFVGTLERLRVVTENHVAALLPYMLKGLKSKIVDYKAATYMVLCQLVVKASLKEELLHPVINSLSKHLTPSVSFEGIACLAVVSQTQHIQSIQDRAFQNICRLPGIVQIVARLSDTHSMAPLMALLLPPLVTATIKGTVQATSEPEDESETSGLTQYSALLESILQDVQLDSGSAKLIATELLNGYIDACLEMTKGEADALKHRLTKVIHIVETRYPAAMDVVMETWHSSVQEKKAKDLAQDFLGLSLAGTKHQVLPESDTSLVLSLIHPQSYARELAVQQLLKNIKEGVELNEFFIDALLERMQDEAPHVILASLWLEESILCRFPTERLFNVLLSILKEWRGRTDPVWYKVGQRVLTLLTTSNLWSDDPHIVDLTMVALLPYLFPVSSDYVARSKLTDIIVQSAMTSHHAMLRKIATVYASQDEDDSAAEKVFQITRSLVKHLASNLAAMDKADRSRMIKLLFHCAKEENGNKKPLKFLAIAIATSTIQQMTNGTQKMEMCQELLGFLEHEVPKVIAIKNKKLHALFEDDTPAISGNWSKEALPSHFVINLEARLAGMTEKSHVVGSHRIDPGLAEVTLWSLSNVLKNLPIPEEVTGNAFWWPELKSDEISLYSSLLKKLFYHVMCGATGSQAAVYCKAFKDLSIQLFMIHVQSGILWKFLPIIWLDQSDDVAARSLKIHGLNVATATVRVTSSENVEKLLHGDSCVVPALLVVMCSHVQPVRKASVNLIQALKKKVGKDCQASYAQLVRHLAKAREELVADQHQLPQILAKRLQKPSVLLSQDMNGASCKLDPALSALLRCLVGSTPSRIRHGILIALSNTDCEAVLSTLVPLLDELLAELSNETSLNQADSFNLTLILEHFTPATADLMSGPCAESFTKALSLEMPIADGLGSPQEIALNQLTKSFFVAFQSVEIQQNLLAKTFDLMMSSKGSSTPSMFIRTLKKLPLRSEHLTKEFTGLEVTTKRSIRQTRKALRIAQATVVEPLSLDKQTIQRFTYIMELIQQRKIKRVENCELLTPCFFAVLQRCLSASSTGDQPSVEYLKQLVLTLLLNLCSHLSAGGEAIPSDVLSEDQINVELVVQCVRVSDNPQTHNHALLLLGSLAKLFPERVLHNIMSIFTFMGAHLLRQDDSYSFQVIQRTVKTIIPTLVQASDVETLDSTLTVGTDNVVAMVLRVFVDALPHIPEHRQLMLFTELVATLGEKRYLWMVIVLLLTNHVDKASALEEEEHKASTASELLLSLCHRNPPDVQLRMLTTLVEYLLKLPQDKPDELQTPKKKKVPTATLR